MTFYIKIHKKFDNSFNIFYFNSKTFIKKKKIILNKTFENLRRKIRLICKREKKKNKTSYSIIFNFEISMNKVIFWIVEIKAVSFSILKIKT